VARVPEAELERLKVEVSVERLAEARGVELRRQGADLIGLCPFHEDHEPSLVISPKKNLWHCLGACQAGGSPIDWVMRERGVSFRHAVELLRADLPFAAESRPLRGGTVRTLPAPVEADADDSELLSQVIGYYHRTLMESPEALGYLEQRGLRSQEAVDRFQLGFANRTLGLRLPLGNRTSGAEIRARLQRLGILRESGHEHFNGSLVVPVIDEAGRVTEVYGRKITANLRAGTPLHLYLPGPHRGVWNEAAMAAGEEVILCEALLDALTFWVHGIRNVTAAYGVEGFTADHLEAFQRHGIRQVHIAYDRDVAGERAAGQLGERLAALGIETYRVHLPQGEDVNSYATTDLETASRRLAQRVRAAALLNSVRVGTAVVATLPAAVDHLTPEMFAGAAKEEEKPGVVPVVITPPFAASPEPPVATPLPPLPPSEVAAEVEKGGGDEVVMQLGGEGGRRWRVRGIGRATSFDLLRVNLLVSRGEGDGGYHVDTLDLYSARQRAGFAKQAAQEIGVLEETVRKDLGQVLLRCETLAEERIRAAHEPQQTAVQLSDEEERAALELLCDPRLVERILADFESCGVVGEETNKLVGYLAVVSRKLERPLAVIVQSSSAAGKSALLEAVLAFVPEEERVKYSALTGQSLFYMEGRDLAHKVLAIVEEEGAERAAYALKLLQSEGELSIASTGKDPATGRLVTHEYRVSGPVAIVLTTTAIDVDEELLNRCLVLTVDEEREQTRAIHQQQRERETLSGLLAERERERLVALHRNAQRLLRPLLVVNPYAPLLRFSDSRTRTRRDHTKYLTLIRAVALLHQHQRERKVITHHGQAVAYIEVTPQDIALANSLSDQVLGRSLDELPPQTRRLLEVVDELVRRRETEQGLARQDVRFTRREVREASGWGGGGDTQLKIHLSRLVDLEHLLVHHGGRGQSFVYELLWDGRGQDGDPVLSGLLDPAELTPLPPSPSGYDVKWSGSEPGWSGLEAERSGSGRPLVGPRSGGGRSPLSAGNHNGHQENPAVSLVPARESTSREGVLKTVVPVPSAAEVG
jgi:DNA primase